jgi:hypothetical protein
VKARPARTQHSVESGRTLLHRPRGEGAERARAAPSPRTAAAGQRGGGAVVARRPRSPAAAAAPAFGARGGELVLGRYRLLEPLGRGGFGEVWRARDELLHRQVAVKRIALAGGSDGRATREAQAAARLSHQAIVALFEAFTVDGTFYLVSELVDGDTLGALFAAGELDDEHLLEIGLALTDALAHAHARGVVHRDIKPQNVLVPRAADGAVAKLTDFGGASLADEQALTRTGDVIGTLAYMAPEQSDGREAGAPADLYSLALVLYEGLSGVNPVRGATPAATARRIGGRLEALGRRRRDLPRPLTQAIDTALVADPAARGTLAGLREALEQALDELPRGRPLLRRAAAHTPPVPVWRRPERQAERAFEPAPAAQPDRPPAAADEAEPASAGAELPAQAPAPGHRAVSRRLWLGGALALVAWQAASGRPGVALLLLAATLPLLALPRRAGPGWLTAALAPLLGAIGVAGCFPAIAGQARSWRARAALGALGYWWLVLAEPLLARQLWLGPAPGTPARGVWEASPATAAAHVIAPLLSTGVALGVAVWALAALVLPWIVRGRSAALDVVAAVTWTAGTAAAARSFDAAAAHSAPRGLVLGAVLAGLIAVAARALRGPV